MDDDFTMTTFERKQIEIQQKTLDFLMELHADIGALRGSIESLTEAIDDMADEDDEPAKGEVTVTMPQVPGGQITAGGMTFNPAVTRWHGINTNGMMNDITKAVQSFKMTSSASGDVTKGYVDGQGT